MNSFKIARNNGNILTVNGSALRIPAFFKREYDGLGYWLHIPENATSDTPLIVVLHSSYGKSDATDKPQGVEPLDWMVTLKYVTERGVEREHNDIPKYVYNDALGDIPAYIIMPQTSSATEGRASRAAVNRGLPDKIISLTNSILAKYGIKSDKVSLTGFSVGGTGAWELAARSSIFKRIYSIAGGLNGLSDNLEAADEATDRVAYVADRLKSYGTRVWSRCSEHDDSASGAYEFYQVSRAIVEAMNTPNAVYEPFPAELMYNHDATLVHAFLDDPVEVVSYLTFSEN